MYLKLKNWSAKILKNTRMDKVFYFKVLTHYSTQSKPNSNGLNLAVSHKRPTAALLLTFRLNFI